VNPARGDRLHEFRVVLVDRGRRRRFACLL
jgi:hypothetical protein